VLGNGVHRVALGSPRGSVGPPVKYHKKTSRLNQKSLKYDQKRLSAIEMHQGRYGKRNWRTSSSENARIKPRTTKESYRPLPGCFSLDFHPEKRGPNYKAPYSRGLPPRGEYRCIGESERVLGGPAVGQGNGAHANLPYWFLHGCLSARISTAV